MSECIICGKEIGMFDELCADCKDMYIKSVFSGKYMLKIDAVKIEGYHSGYMAEDEIEDAIASGNFWRCDHCGGIFNCYAYRRWTFDNEIICEDCYDDSYRTCGDCGDIFLETDMTYDEYVDRFFCADCERKRAKKYIKEYGYKPKPKFKVKAHDEFETDIGIKELLFGVELEIDNGVGPESCAEDICESNENVYCKHDGSLDRGVEIVTHPCTLNYHRDEMDWENITQIALNYEFESHNTSTCGLHIHVGRNQLGNFDESEINETIAKVVLLVDRHWENMVTFSRRSESKLDEWAQKPNVYYDVSSEDELIRNALDTRDDGRYQAVNLTNRTTIEFRLYRGTLNAGTILASLELTSNICEYAKTHSVKEVLASQWEDIIGIKRYRELDEYIGKKSYIHCIEPRTIEPNGTYIAIEDLKVGDQVTVVRPDGYENYAIRNDLLGHTATVVQILKNQGLNVLLDFSRELGCTHGEQNRIGYTYYWLNNKALARAE